MCIRDSYITKEDAKMQSILLCIQTGKTINDVDRMEFQTDEFYLKSTEEMYDLFSMVPEACENTNKIAEQCNFAFTFGETKLPYFKAPDGCLLYTSRTRRRSQSC